MPRIRKGAFWVAALVVAAVSQVGLSAARQSALVDAAKSGDVAAVQALLKQRADVNAAEADGTTALHWAVQQDNLQMVDALLRAKATVTAANRYGVTPVYLAAVNGSAGIMERLLKAGADANTTRPGGESVLMTAARTGNVDTIKLLLAHGADVKARESTRGQDALMWAAVHNNAGAVKTLIEAGADVHARSIGPKTVVTKEFYSQNRDQRVDSFTPLLFAARAGQLEALRTLIAGGANVNDTIEDGTSALVLAVFNAHWELAGVLLEHGADPNAAGQGWTALHQIARVRGLSLNRLPHPVPTGSISSLDLVKKLLQHGANVDARVTRGMKGDQERGRFVTVGATPFLVAAKGFDVDMMRILVAHGADVKATNNIRSTALMLTAGCEVTFPGEDSRSQATSMAALRYTLDLGLDVNDINEAGDTALHGAAFLGFNDVVKLLAERGAKLDVKNKKGWTPLQTAHLDFVGGIFQFQPATATLLREMLQAKGLPTDTIDFEEVRARVFYKKEVIEGRNQVSDDKREGIVDRPAGQNPGNQQ